MIRLKIIGITGGIGSGKSTVSKILSELGAKVIDADRIAQEILFKDGNAIKELTAYFGSEILDEHRELLRDRLSNLVFGHPNKLEVLNGITHKYIIKKIISDVNNIKKEGKEKVLVIDAAIPLEHGFLDQVDEVWVVVAELDTRINRVMKRNCISREQVLGRIKSQKSDEEYIKVGDKILFNNDDVEKLRIKVLNLLNENQ